MRWQKPARITVAIVGMATAVGIYAAMKERAQHTAELPLPRIDPSAVIESIGNVLQQVRGTKQDYLIEADRQLAYKGGATKYLGVRITVRNRGGRDYVISGREAHAGDNQRVLELTGGVKLAANDGFVIQTDAATFDRDSGLMTAPGPVAFERGRMTGSGVGMSYDQQGDVLTLADMSHVVIQDEAGGASTEFTSGKSMFARREHQLSLDGNVRALHEGRVMESVSGIAHLTEDEQHVSRIELRGNARLTGAAGNVRSMSARDMSLHYAGADQSLERVELLGNGAVEMADLSGASGRRFTGDTLDIRLTSDGSMRKAVGGGGVRLDLPSSSGAAGSRIRARAFDADGAPEQGLTAATFTDDVEYQEQTAVGGSRAATSQRLTVALLSEAVSEAVFVGAVSFDEPGLQATAGEARYEPRSGSLRLTAGSGGVTPKVSDGQVTVDASAIAVVLQGRLMQATGGAKTALRGRVSTGDGAAGAGVATRLPNLLKQDQPANINADSMDYRGASGQATYTGHATLWQGETAIRADVITIDLATGNLDAAGDARSSVVLDTGVSVAHAAEIRYADSAHTISYDAGKGLGAAAAPQAQLSGPQGDLRGNRIDVVLGGEGGHVDRLEVYTNVSLGLDARSATGDRLTFYSADERYVMSGGGAKPVRVVEKCKESTGKTITFFKAGDRIIVDGNEEIRTQTKNGAGPACTATPRPR